MRYHHRFLPLVLTLVLLFFPNLHHSASENVDNHTSRFAKIGVVLDLNSQLGSMMHLCMNMALLDFYSTHPDYTTRLQLHVRNTEGVVDANIAVLELLKQERVQAILGSQIDAFTAELGQRIRVPVISFTASSSRYNHYFVSTTPDDSLQARALAAICQGFEWPEVVVLYEDTDYGNRFLSHLHKAFRKVGVGVAGAISISMSYKDTYLLNELRKLSTKQTRVFLVHMNPLSGYRLLSLAKRIGLVSEGYAWIISDSLSNFVTSADSVTRNLMQGFLGIRPYVHLSEELKAFQRRWKRTSLLENTTDAVMELNVYGLWAYDAITALAIAVERIGKVNSAPFNASTGNLLHELGISTFGPQLLHELSRISFIGLSGKFQLIEGRLAQSTFEIFNLYGSGEKTVGFWTPDKGIMRELRSNNEERNHLAFPKELRTVMWPGDCITRPRGWAFPTGTLRVGVLPINGFTDFLNVTFDPVTNHIKPTGFVIDIFLATLKLLPFHVDYDFRQYNGTNNSDWNYDGMLHEIPKNFEMVVGATTIWAPRAAYVDFSLPYSESGAILVVKNKKPFDMWIFIKPLSWDLWLAIFAAMIFMGMVLQWLEHGVIRSDEDAQILGMVYWSPVIVLGFPERNMVSNKWSIFVLLFWLFMAFILMQSYSANLSAILTVDQLKFAYSDKHYVGYQEGSFMKEFLTERLHISEARLRSYSSPEEYHQAMTLGSKNGGIDAIFDEIPYMKILIKKYVREYKMIGPTYRTGGFGFAFPIGSPLVSHFSKAILDVTQGPDMNTIEQKNFGSGYSSQGPLSSVISQGTSSLTLSDFAGLFVIIGSATILAVFFSETQAGRKFIEKVEHYIHICFLFGPSNANLISGSTVRDTDEGLEEEIHEAVQNNANVPLDGQGVDAHIIAETPKHCRAETWDKCPSDEIIGPQDSSIGVVTEEEETV